MQWREQKRGEWGAHEEGSGKWGAVGRGVRRGERVGASQITVCVAGAGRDTDQDWRGNGEEGGGWLTGEAVERATQSRLGWPSPYSTHRPAVYAVDRLHAQRLQQSPWACHEVHLSASWMHRGNPFRRGTELVESCIVLLTKTGPRCISFRCKITVSLAQGAVHDAEADVADPVFVRSTINQRLGHPVTVCKCLVGTLSRTVFLTKCALHRQRKDCISGGPRQSPSVDDDAPSCEAPMALPRPLHQRPRTQISGSRPHNNGMQIPTSWPQSKQRFCRDQMSAVLVPLRLRRGSCPRRSFGR